MAVWAGFPERGREGNKFIVADRPQGHSRGLYCTDSIEAVIEERKMRKENACDILEENGSSHPQESNGLDLMFTDYAYDGTTLLHHGLIESSPGLGLMA